MLKNKFLFLTVLLALFVYACSDAPNDIGADLMPPGDELALDSWNSADSPVPQTSSYYIDTLSMNYSRSVLLGEVNNDVKSHLLLKFLFYDQLPDSVKDALLADSLVINDAWVTAPIIYRYPSDFGSFDFSVHKITDQWSALDFTIDSLHMLSFDENNEYISSEIGDSLFEFHFQPEAVYDWFMSEVSDSIENYGLYLRPEGGSGVLGFPALTTTLTDDRMHLSCIVEKPGAFIDTLDFYTSADVHVVERDIPLGLEDKIIMSAGVITRGKIKFDLTPLPDRIIVNYAIMRLYIDEVETLQGSNPSDTLYFTMIEDSTGTVYETSPSVLGTADSTKVSANVTEMVQRWVNRPEENFGLRLQLTDEKTSVNKLVLYGSGSADSTKLPNLEIVYTKMN